jgi:hypothetical protein
MGDDKKTLSKELAKPGDDFFNVVSAVEKAGPKDEPKQKT